MTLPIEIRNQIADSTALMADLEALADCGGRLAGSDSEQRCYRWLVQRLQKIPSVIVQEHVFQYQGWRRQSAELRLLAEQETQVPCHSLLLSPDTPAGGLEAEVIDVGRGTMADFDAVKGDLKGRIALVQHEYPFASEAIHRRVKYHRSQKEGCVGFIIANNVSDGGLITGSSGQKTAQDIPAVGISYDSGRLISRKTTEPKRVRLNVKSQHFPAEGKNIIADFPGTESETVVICAHYDGHDLAESALDNATGVAAAIQIFETFSAHTVSFRRNLRAMFFTNEEWRLFGSRAYVETLSEKEVGNISLVINLDTLAGSPQLTVLTSGFDEISGMVSKVSRELDFRISAVSKTFANSDHFNFVSRGVPALRLIAGFGESEARTRYLLTEEDTRDKIEPGELQSATNVAAALVWEALTQQVSPKHKSVRA